MPAVITATRQHWTEQVKQAEAALRAKGATGDTPLGEIARIDRPAFTRLIEALVAVGVTVDAELHRLAGLQPAGKALQIPR